MKLMTEGGAVKKQYCYLNFLTPGRPRSIITVDLRSGTCDQLPLLPVKTRNVPSELRLVIFDFSLCIGFLVASFLSHSYSTISEALSVLCNQRKCEFYRLTSNPSKIIPREYRLSCAVLPCVLVTTLEWTLAFSWDYLGACLVELQWSSIVHKPRFIIESSQIAAG